MMKFILPCIVLGLVAYLVKFLPIPEPFMTIIYVVLIIALIWQILNISKNPPSET